MDFQRSIALTFVKANSKVLQNFNSMKIMFIYYLKFNFMIIIFETRRSIETFKLALFSTPDEQR